jgi:outer membrane protein TolC
MDSKLCYEPSAAAASQTLPLLRATPGSSAAPLRPAFGLKPLTFLLLACLAVILAGCKGFPTREERAARQQSEAVAAAYRPGGDRPALPSLGTNSTLADLLLYAMLNHPRVAAAYYDYAAAVERITLERSMPDPRLTLELDIQDVVMTVMPGLMAEVPWTKKLRIRADEASAESQARYFAFESAVLQTAYEVKKPFYQLHFLNDRIRINQNTLRLLGDLEQNARAQTEAGRVTLQDVLRAQIEQERLRTEIENLEDSRNPLAAQLKASLGLNTSQPDLPLPAGFEPTSLDLTSEQLFSLALERNPRLRQMEAEVRMAEAGIRMAHQSRLPDFSVGIEADVKASPTMWRPSLGATLPIWRDKIAAEIAAAQARNSAARARLDVEQIQLAVEFGDKSFMYREATRNLKLLTGFLLPKAQQSLQVARSAYASGKTDFINLLDAERSLLEFELAEVDARTRRELALTELSLLIIGIQPAGAPLPAKASSSGVGR